MAINFPALTRLQALAKSQKFKDIVAAGGGVAVGATVGIMGNSAMSPTKSDKNNQGNLSGTDGSPAAPSAPLPSPAGLTSPTPSDIKREVGTSSLEGAGEGDPSKIIKDLLGELGPFYTGKLQGDTAATLAVLRETEKSALAKSRELSARQIELENIRAWRGITEAQINRETQMALSLADIAYRATQANPATLAGLAPLARVGAESFK